MTKYCKFLKDFYDGEVLAFENNCEYKVTTETDKGYFFGKYGYAVGKDSEDVNYIVIQRQN